MITKPITTVDRVVVLANQRKSVVFNGQRLPAAAVQNWQARFVYNQIKNNRLKEYVTSEKTEKIVSRDLWRSLRTGDTIYSRKTMLPRKILHATGSGSITLQKIKGDGQTIYADCDRANFVIMGSTLNIVQISLCKNGCGCMTHTVGGKCGKCGEAKND